MSGNFDGLVVAAAKNLGSDEKDVEILVLFGSQIGLWRANDDPVFDRVKLIQIGPGFPRSLTRDAGRVTHPLEPELGGVKACKIPQRGLRAERRGTADGHESRIFVKR